MTPPDPTPLQLLDTPMADESAGTIGDLLKNLLLTLWREGDMFSGKKPLGSSDWQTDVYAAMVRAGYIRGSFDAWDCLVRADTDLADKLITEAIKEMFVALGATSATADLVAQPSTPEQAAQMTSPNTTPARRNAVPADALPIQVLRARMDQAREQIVLLSLKSIALQVKEDFPAAAQIALEITEEWPHGLEPGDVLDCEGNAVAPLPRDDTSWKAWSELADRIRPVCNALDTTSEATWGLFCRPTPGSPPADLRLKLDDALAIEPASLQLNYRTAER